MLAKLKRYGRIVMSLLRGRPILVIYDVTRLCNQRCRMCNIWRTKSQDMPLAEIAARAGELRSRGVGYVFLQGGEPTLRPDLLEIVDIFLNAETKPTVITNGILLRDRLASELAARRCNVAISLDTLDRDTFTLIRGVDKLSEVKENIEAAARLTPRKGNWAITTTITELSSLEEVQRLEKFANDLGFMYAIRPYVHVAGTAGRRDDLLAYRDNERIAKIFVYMRDRARDNNYLASVVYDEHLNYVLRRPQPMCDALRRSMVMSPGGLFSPCIEFSGESAGLQEMLARKTEWLERCRKCNRDTPCFYNDAREIGILWRKKWRLTLAAPRIIRQILRYGNFF